MTSPTIFARFLEAGAGIEPQLPHDIEEPAVDRLQAVAHIGQRPVHDGGQRIGEIALFERIAQVDRFDVLRALAAAETCLLMIRAIV